MSFIYVVGGIFIFIVIMQFVFKSRLQKQTGKVIEINDLPQEIKKALKAPKSLIYFFSPTCHNCKHQTPIVEKMKKKYSHVVSFDISKDIASARKFGVMATPTIYIMNKNVVKDILLGMTKEEKLVEKLES